MKSELVFSFPTQRLLNLDVPLEIRDEDMGFVARTLTSQSVKLTPGTYIVTASLPAGQRVVKIVEAKKKREEITLTFPEQQESPHEWREIGHYFASPRAQRAEHMAQAAVDVPGVESLETRPSVTATLRLFGGNFLAGEKIPLAVGFEREDFDRDVAHLRCKPEKELRYVQMLQAGRPAVNIALPISELGCTIAVYREPDRYWIEVYPEDPQANLVLGYTRNHQLQPQVTVAEGMLRDKFKDPIAATVGAYALLRAGELDRLHNWTMNLAHYFAWLPDGTAIRGEHLARMGNHKEALQSFLDVFKRGLPMFSEGIRFTHDRLRSYRGRDASPKVKTALQSMQRFIPYLDFEKAVTTFTGSNPTAPDDAVVKRLPAKDKFDLAKLFT